LVSSYIADAAVKACTVRESAAVSVRQHCKYLSGKHIPAWSPISDIQLGWGLGCFLQRVAE